MLSNQIALIGSSGSGELRVKMLLLSLQSKQPLTSALQLLQRGEKKESMKQSHA